MAKKQILHKCKHCFKFKDNKEFDPFKINTKIVYYICNDCLKDIEETIEDRKQMIIGIRSKRQ